MRILLFYLIFFFGCSTPEQVIQRTIDTVIHYDTLYIPTPVDSSFFVLDQTGFAEDTKYVVKVDTVIKTVFVKGKTQIIKVPVTDTIVRYITNTVTKKDDSFFGDIKFTDILIGGFILIIVLVALRIGGIVK